MLAGINSLGPRNFVPTSYYGTTAFYHAKLMHTPLVWLDPTWQSYTPGLATEWEWSDDDLQLTLHLRDDVRFHDGEPFTSEDVVFTYRLMVRKDRSPAVSDISILQGGPEFKAGSTEELPGVEALDDYTVRFNLTAPSNVFLRNVSNCGILPAHAFGDDALTSEGMIQDLPFFTFENGYSFGTGAWMIGEYVPDSHIRLDANPDYYKGRPILDSITILYTVTGSAGISGLQAGEFDCFYLGAAYNDIRVLDQTGQFRMEFDFDLANTQSMLIAGEKEYLTTPVRQGLVTAIDRQTIVDTATFGYARLPAPSIMMHSSLFPNDRLPEYPYDPERARQLLAEGGWDSNRVIKLGQFVSEGQPSNIVAAIMSMWNEVGVQAEFTPLDPATQVDTARSEDHPYDIVWSALAWLAYDPFSTYAYFACANQPFYANFCNEEYDAYMQEAVRTLDEDRARELYQEAQIIIQTELPYAPLWQEPVTWAFNPRMHGGNPARGPINDIYSELWWKE